MARRLTDIQRVILSAAATRKNRNVFPIPDGVGGKAGTHSVFLMAMLARGLLTERAAGDDEPVWREDEKAGKVALAISSAGCGAIGVELGSGGDKLPPQRNTMAKGRKPSPNAKTRRVPVPAADKARSSKQDTVIALLRRGQGASVSEIMDATGWQGHTVRGFLTATVKGRMKLPLVSEKAEGDERRYHIATLRPSDS